MSSKRILSLLLVTFVLPGFAAADELTQIIQRDLVALGYDPGNTDGDATVPTAVAISRFQAEHDLEVTGEATPQLAGIIKAEMSPGGRPAIAATPLQTPAPTIVAAPAASDAANAASLQSAQQACLQQRINDRQESEQKKRGFARLARAVTRTASRPGGDDVSREVSELSSAVYDANAIAGDLQGAAEDLGLTESDIEECRTPS